MSRIGKKPVTIPTAVRVDITGGTINVQGPKGKLNWAIPGTVSVALDAAKKQVVVNRKGENKLARAMHGTARALINNMVKGVTDGYTKSLEIYGTGYGVKVNGKALVLTVGFAHTIDLQIPDGVTVNIEVPQTRGNDVPAKFSILGIDKQVVGQFVRTIKDSRPPEPYQGKGIRYKGEQIKRKAGKAFAGGAAGA